MTDSGFLYFAAALIVVTLVVPVLRWAALRSGFVDKPGGRKKHDDPVPPVGGLAVFPVFMALCVIGAAADISWRAYFIAMALLLALGAIDDRRGVPAWVKFAVQFIAAYLVVVYGLARVTTLGDLFGFGAFGLGFMTVPFSVIATVLLINAVNLMDGLDGLAGGTGFVVMAWLAVACYAAGAAGAALPVMILAGALAGFLLYNMRHPLRRRASIFLGDSGSLALGLSLAWFGIKLGSGTDPVIAPIAVAWLFALPIFDTCGQFARRVSQGRHPFDADHDHFHHHFIYAGFSVGQSSAIIIAITALSGLIGIGGLWLGLPEAALTYPWIALLLAHIYMSMRPHRFRRLVSRLRRGAGVPDG